MQSCLISPMSQSGLPTSLMLNEDVERRHHSSISCKAGMGL